MVKSSSYGKKRYYVKGFPECLRRSQCHHSHFIYRLNHITDMASNWAIGRVRLSQTELVSRIISPDNLLFALESLHKHGICILENAVNLEYLRRLNERMVADATARYKEQQAIHNFGSGTGNIQLAMPLNKDFVFDDIIANPFVTAITECMLGPNPVLRFQSGNAAFKAGNRQPVHVDLDYPRPDIPYGMCVNIALVEMSPANGATEFWPGTHLISPEVTNPGIIVPTLLERQRQVNPPIQLSAPAGSIIIRDLKLWHAGMPNHTDDVRILLIGIQLARWYQNELKMQLPLGSKDKIQWGRLSSAVEWVEEDAKQMFFSFSDLAPSRSPVENQS